MNTSPYRTKPSLNPPFTVEAVHITAENLGEVSHEFDGRMGSPVVGDPFTHIETSTGPVAAYPGDWVIVFPLDDETMGLWVYDNRAFTAMFEPDVDEPAVES